MNANLRDAAVQLVERAAAIGQKGKTADKGLLEALVRDAKGHIPPWYAELITTVPLCGLELGWQAHEPVDDYDGIEWMVWSDPRNMRSESIECYPGLAILEYGYVNVASDSGGGGDPYFIAASEGEDPPLYQVYHDVSDQGTEIIAEGRGLVAKSLSEFFQKALIPGA
jgi:hypothetical protein